MISRNLITKMILLAALVVVGMPIQAQKKRKQAQLNTDTLTVFRELVQLSSRYQQAPLYLELELSNSTNFITAEEDTARITALFYIKPGISYMRFGDAEQLVNDSLALLVNDKAQRMILFTNAQPVLQRMKGVAGGLWLQDSSLLQLSSKFSAQHISAEENKETILLAGKRLLPGTSLQGESIAFQYNTTTKEPVQVTTIKRSLIPIAEDVYSQLKLRTEMAGKLIAIEDKYFVVKEQQAVFVYKKISHDAGIQVPAVITDRLIRNEEGFMPTNAYQQYAITIN